jgi:hypothetical protein
LIAADQTVGDILQGYADRGVFRGFARRPSKGGKAAFEMVWHRGRRFEVTLDMRRGKLHCPVVLPQVPAALWREFRAFVESVQDPELLEHRRIDRRKAVVTCANRGGNVSLTMIVTDGDYEYATRKCIHLIQEIYLGFLTEHFDYQVDVFELDPDRP